MKPKKERKLKLYPQQIIKHLEKHGCARKKEMLSVFRVTEQTFNKRLREARVLGREADEPFSLPWDGDGIHYVANRYKPKEYDKIKHTAKACVGGVEGYRVIASCLENPMMRARQVLLVKHPALVDKKEHFQLEHKLDQIEGVWEK